MKKIHHPPRLDRFAFWLFDQMPRPEFTITFWITMAIGQRGFFSGVSVGYAVFLIVHITGRKRELRRFKSREREVYILDKIFELDRYTLAHHLDKNARN